MSSIRAVCVYCGSSPGRGESFRAAGEILGKSLASAGLRLVYGGGDRGVMGAVAAGAIEAGGRVTGIIPKFLLNRETSGRSLQHLDETIVTETMHERKQLMFDRSDAFVALPGGIGTLEEIVEIMTWGQLGHHRKPIVLANVEGFWDPMTALLDHMRDAGFIHTGHLVRPLVIDKAEAIVPALLAAANPVDPSGDGDTEIIRRM